MCLYAHYRYKNCPYNHALANSPHGARPFCVRNCKLNCQTPDEWQYSARSTFNQLDLGRPCDDKQTQIFYVNQPCHVCRPDLASKNMYPLNTDYNFPAGEALGWILPYVEDRGPQFRDIDYTNDPKTTAHEAEQMSPKGGPRVLPRSDKRPHSSFSSSLGQYSPSQIPYPAAPPALTKKGGNPCLSTTYREESPEKKVGVMAPQPYETAPWENFYDDRYSWYSGEYKPTTYRQESPAKRVKVMAPQPYETLPWDNLYIHQHRLSPGEY